MFLGYQHPQFTLGCQRTQLFCSVTVQYQEKKVKCTLVQALRPCTGRKAHRGSRDIVLYSFLTTALAGVEGSASRPGKDPVTIVQETEWASGPVWTGAENLTPTGIRSPGRPACSQSLYRLSYPAHVQY